MTGVPRETTPPPPPSEAAAQVFPPARLELAVRYCELLAGPGVVRGLIGPRETPRLWDRHLVNCGLLAELLPAGSSTCDIGSGAGLPGLVLAIARPDVELTLVEPLLRRTTFLQETVTELGLVNVEVVRARADALHGSRTFDVVTSRAVAPLPKLLAWSMPLVAPTGSLVAMKGSSAGSEVAEAAEDAAAMGCAPPEIVDLGAGLVAEPTSAVVVSWSDPAAVSSRRSHGAGGARRAPRRGRTAAKRRR